jgi:hypothetical protein
MESRFLGSPDNSRDNSPAGGDIAAALLVIAFSTAASAAGVDIIAEAVDVSVVVVPVARDMDLRSGEGSKTFGTLLENVGRESPDLSVTVGTGSDAIVETDLVSSWRFFSFFFPLSG